jgi:hypothetical protein
VSVVCHKHKGMFALALPAGSCSVGLESLALTIVQKTLAARERALRLGPKPSLLPYFNTSGGC